ncbi:GSCFA domain-containing protein [Psychroserpens algicola]|uniref:GSCFA domain-containing protein n=1 Tax=Psychroserpens algicola TaxID=1719034 RepID=A0ABT0HAG8_9FLAO|nr:GSCFA domain-containing protein [Psychroserpens algicola]MCK8481346.1 GSCFA domain-containing protein [Psychroserpens algicola]
MNLQTKIPLQPQQFNRIDYNSKVMLIGSCFSEYIGERFEYFKFQKLQNPFGILFHPLAIETVVTNAINKKTYTDSDVFFHNEQWHCYEAHSKLSRTSKDQLLDELNTRCIETYQFLNSATHVILTLGTAWAYRFIETDSFVANCHKVPQKRFLKELLSVDQISESLNATMSLIKSVNPEVSFIFTISPVRHIKDGFVENTLSKSHLIAAVHQIIEPRHHQYYFPSYEIMMDELRDYRFYKDDMLHPNNIAINYIWKYFQDVWISEDTHATMNDVDAIQKGMAHRPFNPESDAYTAFLQQLKSKETLVKSRFPHIVF